MKKILLILNISVLAITARGSLVLVSGTAYGDGGASEFRGRALERRRAHEEGEERTPGEDRARAPRR